MTPSRWGPFPGTPRTGWVLGAWMPLVELDEPELLHIAEHLGHQCGVNWTNLVVHDTRNFGHAAAPIAQIHQFHHAVHES